MAKAIEVTFVDSGKTEIMSRRRFRQFFGAAEGREILAGYLPHIVAVETNEEPQPFRFRIVNEDGSVTEGGSESKELCFDHLHHCKSASPKIQCFYLGLYGRRKPVEVK